MDKQSGTQTELTQKRILRVVTASIFGVIFYLLWLVLFLLNLHFDLLAVNPLWFLAPVLTGFGYYLGILLFDRLAGVKTHSPGLAFLWPLVGCSLGAFIVYWLGPMLIVFSMLVFGALSVAARDYFLSRWV
jgi:hypothetical protein